MLMTTLVTALSLLLADGPPAKAPAADVWQLTLRDAIRIGLENSEVIRIVSDPARNNSAPACVNNAPIVIARLNADASVWNFKAAVMARVRSIEQQYWALSQQLIQISAREQAVKLNEEFVRRERADLENGSGRGGTADVAEAQQNLEAAHLVLITAKADLIVAERQFRNILGVRGEDKRRIIPVTAPIEAPVEPHWDSCLAQMLAEQPDIVQQQLLVRMSELKLLVTSDRSLPLHNLYALYQLNGLWPDLDKALPLALSSVSSPDKGFEQWQVGLDVHDSSRVYGFRAALANLHAAQYQVLRQRAFLEQVVHQTTHSLARFFLEVDSNYKQFKAASRCRQAAQARLETARAYYEEGRTGFSIDRLFDAVNQQANAIALEAQFKSSYNTSIVALEEAKGTLLADDNIVVLESGSRQDQDEERGLQVAKERIIPEWPAIPLRAVRWCGSGDSAAWLSLAISRDLKPIPASLYEPPTHVLSQPVPALQPAPGSEFPSTYSTAAFTTPVPAAKTAPWYESLPAAFGLVMPTAYSSYLKPIAVSSCVPPTRIESQPAPAADAETWYLSLHDAIRIGLENSKVLRIIRDEPPSQSGSLMAHSGVIRIAATDTQMSPASFRAALMAHVRSVEQQYWAIAQERATVEIRAQAVKMCEEIVRRVKAEPEQGRGTTCDLAEATQSLERWQLAYISAQTDLLTTERQLRNILGLPATDSRRIITGSPRKDKVEPIWDDCVAALYANQPEILDEAAGVEKSTQTLARFFLAVKSCYNEAVTATKLREAARDRLKAANAFYDKGRTGFTIDRLLEAVNQDAGAATQEARGWATYNTALAALGESKGTLLTEKHIVVVRAPRDEPGSKDRAVVATVAEGKTPAPAAKPLSFDLDLLPVPAPALIKTLTNGVLGVDVDLNVRPTWHLPQAADPKSAPKVESAISMPAPPPGAKTIRYGIQIDGWAQPLQIQGSISIGPETKKER